MRFCVTFQATTAPIPAPTTAAPVMIHGLFFVIVTTRSTEPSITSSVWSMVSSVSDTIPSTASSLDTLGTLPNQFEDISINIEVEQDAAFLVAVELAHLRVGRVVWAER